MQLLSAASTFVVAVSFLNGVTARALHADSVVAGASDADANGQTAGALLHAAHVRLQDGDLDGGLSATCNGGKVEKHGSDERFFAECWGHFKMEVNWDKEDSSGKFGLFCEGAFEAHKMEYSPDSDDADALASIPADLRAVALEHVAKGHAMNVTTASCSGDLFQFSKTVIKGDESRLDAFKVPAWRLERADLDTAKAASSGAVSDGEAFGYAQVFGCSGELSSMTIASAEHGWSHTSTKCSAFAVAGDGVKSMSGSAGQTLRSLLESDGLNEDELRSIVRQSPPSTWSSVLHSQPHTSQPLNPAPAPVCRALCNGKPLTWKGLWPCKGKLTSTCSGSVEAVSTDWCAESECLGLSLPAAMACHGMSFEKVDWSKMDKSMNGSSILVVNGGHKVAFKEKMGYKGRVHYAHGHVAAKSKIVVDKDDKEHSVAA